MNVAFRAGWAFLLPALLAACNSDVPVSASAIILPQGIFTVTRVATHPFLARYNLRFTLQGAGGCRVEADLFPDTGYVSRRNLYQVSGRLFYLVGQYDARVVDVERCSITLAEFRSLDPQVSFLGSFDVNDDKQWVYMSSGQRPERPFEKR